MDDKKNNLPAAPAPIAPRPLKRAKRFSLGLEAALKANKFSPVSFWIKEVLPQLSPQDQSKAILNLLPYLYPTYRALEVEKPKASKVTTNIQVNVPSNSPGGNAAPASPSSSSISLEDLYAIAASAVKPTVED